MIIVLEFFLGDKKTKTGHLEQASFTSVEHGDVNPSDLAVIEIGVKSIMLELDGYHNTNKNNSKFKKVHMFIKISQKKLLIESDHSIDVNNSEHECFLGTFSPLENTRKILY